MAEIGGELFLSGEISQEVLQNVILLAKYYHKGQVDKNGEDYILHPLRVMNCVHSTEEKIVAILHDILEDTKCTEEILLLLCKNRSIIDTIKLLTRLKEDTYFQYIEKVRKNPLARKVKIADLKDNLSREGASSSLQQRHRKALEILE